MLLSHVQLFVTPWNSPGQNTGVGSHSLLQGIFQTQGLNPGLSHCRWILYKLSHKKSSESYNSQFKCNFPVGQGHIFVKVTGWTTFYLTTHQHDL